MYFVRSLYIVVNLEIIIHVNVNFFIFFCGHSILSKSNK